MKRALIGIFTIVLALWLIVPASAQGRFWVLVNGVLRYTGTIVINGLIMGTNDAHGAQLLRNATGFDVVNGTNSAFSNLRALNLTAMTGGSVIAPIYNGSATSTLTVSSNTIAPTTIIHHVGAGLIKTITVPANCSVTCWVNIIPDAAYTYDATGNIVVPAGGGTAVINKLMTFAWDGTKWAPSY